MTAPFRRVIFWSAISLLLVGVLAWSFWPQPVSVEFASVTRGPLSVTISDEGRTRVRELYKIMAPVNGQLSRVEKHAGDKIAAGSMVAYLLPTTPSFLDVRTRTQAEAAVKSAEAARNLTGSEVRKAKAELEFAKADLKRATSLSEQKAIARVDFERAKLARETADAQLATAQAALRSKEYDLETARALLMDPGNAMAKHRQQASIPLIAPVSGRVLRVLQESEAVVAAGTPILEIGDPLQLEILVDLISEDALKVRVGAKALITDWGGAKPLNARVRRIEPSGFTKISALGVEEQRVNVLLDFTDDHNKWSSIGDGFRIVSHIIIWEARDVVRVPVEAMFRHGDGWAVFTRQNDRARLTPIQVGHSNDRLAEVLGGLREGDQVIARPSDRVADGVAVNDAATN